MGVKIREKRGYLYLDVYWNGKRYWETLHLSVGSDPATRREAYRLAEKIRSKKEFQLAAGDHGLIDHNAGRRSVVAYAKEVAARMNPKNPVPKSIPYLERYAEGIQLGAINERWLEGYQDFLTSQERIGPSTAAKYYAAIVQVLRLAVRDRLIPRNPATAVKGLTAPETVREYLTPTELQKLADTKLGGVLGGQVKRAFLFAALTGLRISDLRSLTWGNINRETLQVAKRQGKTERVVYEPLHESAWAIIDDGEDHDRDDYVFPLLHRTKTNTNDYLKSWAKRAAVHKAIGWHTARHTFATLSLEGGAEIYTVSKLLGHTRVKTTEVYAKATDRMKKKAVEGLPKIELKESER